MCNFYRYYNRLSSLKTVACFEVNTRQGLRKYVFIFKYLPSNIVFCRTIQPTITYLSQPNLLRIDDLEIDVVIASTTCLLEEFGLSFKFQALDGLSLPGLSVELAIRDQEIKDSNVHIIGKHESLSLLGGTYLNHSAPILLSSCGVATIVFRLTLLQKDQLFGPPSVRFLED